ncbi:hypothetical protein [Devosia sp. CN2-171]|uniref:hypothetical protein n=1 Tax=Devosia sp. CN2-171 TaxID=3400909 RepID=UPI003BF855CD
MPEMHRYLDEAKEKLGHEPASADDIVVMVSDVLYDYLPPDSGVSAKEALGRLLAIIESPMALEVYENEMQRRNPRDADRWH